MRKLLLGFALAIMSAATAYADAPANPILEHFRSYRAALERGDLVTAEAEGEAALAASEAADGGGGRTAVLAQNLAEVRLRLNDASALQPAQRAFELASAGATGVTPLYAGLVLGRAELAAENGAGADRLNAILHGPSLAELPEEEIYSSAEMLGRWTFRHADYASSEFAWSVAAAHPDGSILGRVGGYGNAHTWQGAAILFEEVGPRGTRRVSQERGGEAYLLLSDAVETLRPISSLRDSDGAVTVGTRAYADALALRQIARAKLMADERRVPETPVAEGDIDGFAELAVAASGPVALTRRCQFEGRYQPLPEYPPHLLSRGAVGAVVLLMRLDATGQTESTEVLTRVGDEEFADAVTRVANRWSVRVRADSAPGCRLPRTIITPATFVLR